MKKSLQSNLSLYFLLFLCISGCAAKVSAQDCQLDNVYLQAMPESLVAATTSNNEKVEFNVRTAINSQTRAAGFQWVCASVIAEKPILFLFDQPSTPSFHMRNVVAPIDIAFIDQKGQVESIHEMLPYVIGSIIKPLYSPSREVIAALEVTPGFYQENNIEVGSVIKWESIEEVNVD